MIAAFRRLRQAPRHHGYRPQSRLRGALCRLAICALATALAAALCTEEATGAGVETDDPRAVTASTSLKGACHPERADKSTSLIKHAGEGSCGAKAPAPVATGNVRSDFRYDSPGDRPGIAELRVQVMPEFDDPRVLVIVQGRLDINEDGLPVELTLPVPRGAQINQMAIMNTGTGAIESQPFDAEPDPDSELWTLVTYELSSAHFFYEYYYAPFLVGNPERHFVFDFPTPYAVDGLKIEVQQPLEATGFSLAPPATLAQVDETMGFTYHLYEIGTLGAGETTSIDIAYRKETADPSITREELMGPQMQGGADGPADMDSTTGSSGDNLGLWLGLGVVGLISAGAAAWTWAKKRSPSRGRAQPRPVPPRRATPQPEVSSGAGAVRTEQGAHYCTDCGARLRTEARFCHVCGSRVDVESV